MFSLENISKRNEQEGATFGCSLAIFETTNRLALPRPQGFGWGSRGRGGEGRPRVRLFGSGSPVEIRLFGFSPEGGTSLPACVSRRTWDLPLPKPQTQHPSGLG
jgi:hypothetical protein